MDGFLDYWIIGFEYMKNQRSNAGKRNFKKGILDFPHIIFFA
jgi:hypothetical protein